MGRDPYVDPYLKGMKLETDLESKERSDMRCRQNADDDQRRGLALAGGLQRWPLYAGGQA